MGKTTRGVGVSFPVEIRERIASLAKLRRVSFSAATLDLIRRALDVGVAPA